MTDQQAAFEDKPAVPCLVMATGHILVPDPWRGGHTACIRSIPGDLIQPRYNRPGAKCMAQFVHLANGGTTWILRPALTADEEADLAAWIIDESEALARSKEPIPF